MVWQKIWAWEWFGEISTVWWRNYGNLLSRSFGKNFVKVTVLLHNLLKSYFDEKKIGEREFLVFPHCAVELSQCGNCCNLVSHIFGKNFVKVTFLLKEITKYLIDFMKYFFCETKSLIFPHCDCGKVKNLLSLKKYFVKSTLQ